MKPAIRNPGRTGGAERRMGLAGVPGHALTACCAYALCAASIAAPPAVAATLPRFPLPASATSPGVSRSAARGRLRRRRPHGSRRGGCGLRARLHSVRQRRRQLRPGRTVRHRRLPREQSCHRRGRRDGRRPPGPRRAHEWTTAVLPGLGDGSFGAPPPWTPALRSTPCTSTRRREQRRPGRAVPLRAAAPQPAFFARFAARFSCSVLAGFFLVSFF
jgi:hypothetical protein